ncbi:hypothetical protein Hamer_G026376 [Homarus americanus]|uniref:Uncharacterized protein n=1 Tax=Homarus americanus TaxID=6706 RepID=A0A8J5JFI7_HOMAM|nr:hypothetical protein Hamer_G026376 [Homarus americanus]
MPLSFRPWFSTPSRTRRGHLSSATLAILAQAQSVLMSQQQAIVSLQASLASMSAPRQSSQPLVSRATAPEKCDLEMSSAIFRSWRRSTECWLQLNKWPDADAILCIHLLCVPAL